MSQTCPNVTFFTHPTLFLFPPTFLGHYRSYHALYTWIWRSHKLRFHKLSRPSTPLFLNSHKTRSLFISFLKISTMFAEDFLTWIHFKKYTQSYSFHANKILEQHSELPPFLRKYIIFFKWLRLSFIEHIKSCIDFPHIKICVRGRLFLTNFLLNVEFETDIISKGANCHWITSLFFASLETQSTVLLYFCGCGIIPYITICANEYQGRWNLKIKLQQRWHMLVYRKHCMVKIN